MVTVTCKYTGIQFEAETRRTKNHPQVTAFLKTANEDGDFHKNAYGKAKELLAVANGQYGNIDDLMLDVQAQYGAWKSGEAAPVAARRTAGVMLREKKANPRRWNGEKVEDEESMDFAGPNAWKYQ